MEDLNKPPVTPEPQVPVTPAKEPVQVPVTPTPPVTPAPGAIKPGDAAAIPPEGDKTVPISALLEEREKRQSLQGQIESLKKVVGQNVVFDMDGKPIGYNQPINPQQNQQQQYEQNMEKLWESDPRKAVQTEIYQAMAWRDNQEAAVDNQENAVAGKYADFNEYRSDVRQYIRTLPLEQRGNQGVVELAYYVIKGQKVDNLIAKTREQVESEYRQKLASGQGVSPLPTGSSGAPPPANPGTLSQEEATAADAMGVPREDYVRYKKMV